jgi:TatD DNase family protein
VVNVYQSTVTFVSQTNREISYADAHCHINLFDEPFKVIENAFLSGLEIIVSAGGSTKDNKEISKIVGQRVFGVVGIDPQHIEDKNSIKELKGIIESNRNIIGIGEIGLDKKFATESKHYEMQKEMFREQLELAESLDLPVVIHSRKALDDVLSILGEFKVRAMFHFFEGDDKDIEKMREYFISVPPLESSKRKRAIGKIGIERIMLETDSPVVGKDPTYVKISAEIVAKIKGLDIEKVAYETTENVRKFFYI